MSSFIDLDVRPADRLDDDLPAVLNPVDDLPVVLNDRDEEHADPAVLNPVPAVLNERDALGSGLIVDIPADDRDEEDAGPGPKPVALPAEQITIASIRICSDSLVQICAFLITIGLSLDFERVPKAILGGQTDGVVNSVVTSLLVFSF
jgi:hypothetical protein